MIVNDKTFYIDHPQGVKLFHFLDSTSSYTGPDRFWIGSPNTDERSKYYYKSHDSSQSTIYGKDIAIAFSYNNIQIEPHETKTLGIKFSFMSSTPEITYSEPEWIYYGEGEKIAFKNIIVTNVQDATVKIDFNGTTVQSKQFYPENNKQYTISTYFKVPKLEYKTEQYCVELYAVTEYPTARKRFCFNYVNVPKIESVDVTQIEGTNQAQITGTLNDKDAEKQLYVYAKVDGRESPNYQVGSIKSNGGSQDFTASLDISNLGGRIEIKIWLSTKQFSTDTSDEAGENAKSKIKTKYLTLPDLPKPKLTITFPSNSNKFPRNKKVHLTGTTEPAADFTMKFLIDEQDTGKSQEIHGGSFSFDFELPQSIPLGDHKLKVYIVNSMNTASEHSNAYSFTVENSLPVVQEVSLDRSSVEGGQQVTVTGKIKDIDSGSQMTIIAKHGTKILGTTNLQSTGSLQTFTFQITTETVTEETTYEVELEVSDGSDTFISETKPRLTVTPPKPTLTVNFPDSNKFPRNKKVHLSGTISQNKDFTMKFIIDEKEIGTTQQIRNGAFDFEFSLPDEITIDKHTLKVYVMSGNTKSEQSRPYEFTVVNALPVLQNVKIDKNTVHAGEQVTITGKIKDIDSGNKIKITARYGEGKSTETTVTSDGTLQVFTIHFVAEKVLKETTYEIVIEANDGSGTFTSNNKLSLTIKDPKPTLSVIFPQEKAFPRNRKVHLKGTAIGEGDFTMMFIIDNFEIKKQTQTIQNGDFDFKYDLPARIKVGSHQLKVYIIDNQKRKSDISDVFDFEVQNSLPFINEISINKNPVKPGEKVTITGKVKDIDYGNRLIITALSGDSKLASTTLESNGEYQKFTIEFTAETVTEDISRDISFVLNDSTDTYTSELKIELTISNKAPDSQDSKPSNNQPTNQKNNQMIYIIIGVVAACLLIIIIIAIIAILVAKKKKKNSNNNTVTEGGYLRDQSIEYVEP